MAIRYFCYVLTWLCSVWEISECDLYGTLPPTRSILSDGYTHIKGVAFIAGQRRVSVVDSNSYN